MKQQKIFSDMKLRLSYGAYNYGTYGFVIHEIAEMVALDMGQYTLNFFLNVLGTVF